MEPVDEIVFHDREYTLRNPENLVGATFSLLLAAVGLTWAVRVIPNIDSEIQKQGWPHTLFGLAFMAITVPLLVGMSVALNWGFWIDHRRRMRIDGNGILFGTQFLPWKQISAVGLVSRRGWNGIGYYPVFSPKRVAKPKSELHFAPVFGLLTVAEGRQLLDQLSDYLGNHFPRVEVNDPDCDE
jgi:hypothetical protein